MTARHSAWRLWCAAGLVAALSGGVDAADYYVHAVSGNDLNDGSAAAPFHTLTRLQSAMQAGDRAFLAGTFRERLILAGLSNITVAQWAGQEQAVLRGDRVITSAWSGGPTVWSTTLAPGQTAAAVVVDWDTSVDSFGRHYGFLRAATDFTTVSAIPNSFLFDGATRTLTVNLNGDDPTAHQVAYCVGGTDGLTIYGGSGGVTNVTVDGIHSYLWADRTPGTGYGFKMRDCRNSVLRNHVAIDNGYHGTGWVNYSVPNTNNHEENGVVWGANDDSCYVFYTSVGDVTGARWTDCVAYKYTILGRGGSPISPFDKCTGFHWHTSGAGPLVKDLEATGCRVYEFADGNTAPAFAGQNSATAGDTNNWLTYPARLIGCAVIRGKGGLVYPNATAFVRCSLDYSLAGSSATSSEAVFADNGGGGPGAFLFDACEVMVNLDGNQPRAFFGVRDQIRWTFINSSILDSGVNNLAHRLIMWYAPQAGVVARGSIFAFRNRAGTRGLNYNDNNAAWLGLHDFKDCVYANVSDSSYSTVSNGSYNDKAEWKALVDPEGLYLTQAPFADPTGATGLALDPGGPLAGVRKRLAIATTLGINGVAYSGTYGAYQDACAADLNNDGFVNGDDYDFFAGAFDEGSPDADFNHDGFVNGDDYDAFAVAFEAGC